MYKFDIDGFLIKYKARLYVCGDLQIMLSDIYAATLAACLFQVLMVIVAAFDLEIQQYDAINVFVNSEINKKVYYECPEGFTCPHMFIKL